MAAASRSSSMSLSSPSNFGSINTFFASCLPFNVTLTMPAPDSPVTSISANSACAFCIVSCICCAWRIRFPKPPFIIVAPPQLVGWFDRGCIHIGAEALAQPLHSRVRLERACGARDPILFRLDALACRRVQCGFSRFERDSNVAAKILRQALHEFLLDGPRAPIRRGLIEPQGQQAVLETTRHTIQRKLAHHAAQCGGLDDGRPIAGIDAGEPRLE